MSLDRAENKSEHLLSQSSFEAEQPTAQMRSFPPPPFQLKASGDQAEGESGESDFFAEEPIQAMSIASYSGGTVQRQESEDPYADYKGAAVNKPGWVSAPGAEYDIAKTEGVKIREKPNGALSPIGRIIYGKKTQVVCLDTTGQFYYVVALQGGPNGWINKSYVTMDQPGPGAVLHNIQESNLITILKNHYVDTGKWAISTGNDYTTLATAVQVANSGRAGVSVNWAEVQKYKDDHPLKGMVDPWMVDNFAIMHASDIVAGTNIWLPSASYINALKESGVIGSRPEWINTAVDVGKGIAGFYSGLYTGIFEGLWSMVEGLWEIGKQIVNTVTGILDGSLFSSISELYDRVTSMSAEEMMDMVNSIVTMGQDAWGDFVTSWTHPNMFKKWNFRGRIVGQIALEVVLAIFTGGASLGAKVLLKIGAKFPKLARMLSGLLKAADKITPNRKKRPDGPDGPDRPKDHDGKDGDGKKDDRDKDDDQDMSKDDRAWEQSRAMAALVTEGHDVKDTPVEQVITHLNAQFAVPSKVVSGYKANPNPDGSYEVIQMAKRKKTVDPHYTEANPRRDVNDHEGDGLGHTVERHVGKSDNWLRRRLQNNPGMDAASTFTSEAAANRAQAAFVKKHKAEIAEWLKGSSRQMTKEFDTGIFVGRVLEKGKSSAVTTKEVFILIRRNPDVPQGWYFHTSYPV
jgi:hypothetical protein